MNEFIVWDEENSQFLTKKEIAEDSDYQIRLSLDGDLELWYLDALADTRYGNNGEHEPCSGWIKLNVIFLDGIGKTDIEGNNIYADSSIVEFEVPLSNKKSIGFFTWIENRLRYVVKFKHNETDTYHIMEYSSQMILNIKIIDTLQENKLGLVGDKDEK